jgi:hypothetical protein
VMDGPITHDAGYQIDVWISNEPDSTDFSICMVLGYIYYLNDNGLTKRELMA